MLAVENRHTYAYTARPFPIANWEKDMETFEYNSCFTYQHNFENWYMMNSKERRMYKQPEYDRKEAIEVFNNIFKNKLAHSIKVNADGILEDVLVVE